MTGEKRKPIHELRLGGVKAAIWENRSDKTGTWYSVTLSRLYKQGESWKRSESFGPSELPLLSKIADMATQWIQFKAAGKAPGEMAGTASGSEFAANE